MSFKTVIIATDFSSQATNAMLYVVQAAQSVRYKLVLFHLYNPSIHALNDISSTETLDELLANREEKLRAVTKEMNTLYQTDMIAYFATGNFFEELERCIGWYQADLLAMGMAGKSMEQDLLGNSTTAAINRLKFPVLAIPEGAVFHGIIRILFAVDMLRGFQKKVLSKLKEFAEDFGAGVEVLYVREKIEELASQQKLDNNLALLEKEMTGIDYVYKNVSSQKIIEVIREEIITAGADLFVMLPQKHGFWESIIHKSKTRVMASGMEIPLLSLPL